MADDDTKQSREEFAEARRALVDKYVADHPGLAHTDFNDIKIGDFDSHAKTLYEQRQTADRDAAARHLNMSTAEIDAFQAARQEGHKETTPEQRSANLPTGKATLPPPSLTNKAANATTGDGEPKTMTDLIEAQAAEDIAIWQSTGKWPRKSNPDAPDA